MRGFRWVLLAAGVAWAVGAVSCSGTAGTCSPTTCEGCCTEDGQCVTGTEPVACGFGGALCRECRVTQVCASGICVTPAGAGGGAGEGGGSGDDGGSQGGGAGGGAQVQGACAGSLVSCGTQCVDHLADPSNCGGCGRVCNQGQVCNNGSCTALPSDCTLSSAGCGPGYSCDPLTKQCTPGCRLVTDCPVGATCTGGACQCPMGQHICGQQCVPDDALSSCGTRCRACVAPAGGTVACTAGQCVSDCGPGYGDDAGVCADVDECQAGTAACHPEATCANTPGSYRCACNPGFEGDGGSCSDINECATNNGGCHVSATCTNLDGGFACACRTGFTGDGGACTDVNECLMGNGGCASIATCTNTDGGRTCTCPTGYTGNGVTCTDINECATNNGGCHANATCTNTPGSRTCTCNPGFTGNGFSCTPQQEGESCAVAQVLPISGNYGSHLGTTVGFTNDHATTCVGSGTFGTVGPDRVYAISVPAGKLVRVTVNPRQFQAQWDPVLYLVAAPASNCLSLGTSCLAGSDDGGVTENERATWRNTATSARTVFAIVDGKTTSAEGPFLIGVDILD